MFGRPELSTNTRCRSRMSLLTEVPYLERKATDGFFRSVGYSPPSRLEKQVTMSTLNFWREGHRSADRGKASLTEQTFMWIQKVWVVQGTMTPQCALQMRSTFGTDILMQETGPFWGREPRSSSLPKKTMKEDEKSHMGMQTRWERCDLTGKRRYKRKTYWSDHT